jgi:hypothetical protein
MESVKKMFDSGCDCSTSLNSKVKVYLVCVKVNFALIIVIYGLINVYLALAKVNLAFVIVLFALINVLFALINVILVVVIVFLELIKVNLALIIVIYELQKVKRTKKNKIG